MKGVSFESFDFEHIQLILPPYFQGVKGSDGSLGCREGPH